MALCPKLPSLVDLVVYDQKKKADNSLFPKCNETKNKKTNYTSNKFESNYADILISLIISRIKF